MRVRQWFLFLVVGIFVAPIFCYGQNDIYILLQKAEQGDVHAQSTLGYAYAKGLAVQQNYQQAAYWWKKAATKGDADAQYNLGLLYESGKGVPQDRIKAAKSWRRASEKGHARAQWRMSVCYTDGKWVKPKPDRAAHWASLAMKSGYTGNLKKDGRVTSKILTDENPYFSASSFGSAKFPIVTYEVNDFEGTLSVDLSKTGNDREKIRAKMIDKIETACSYQNILVYAGEKPPPGAAYRISSEKEVGNIFTITFDLVK